MHALIAAAAGPGRQANTRRHARSPRISRSAAVITILDSLVDERWDSAARRAGLHPPVRGREETRTAMEALSPRRSQRARSAARWRSPRDDARRRRRLLHDPSGRGEEQNRAIGAAVRASSHRRSGPRSTVMRRLARGKGSARGVSQRVGTPRQGATSGGPTRDQHRRARKIMRVESATRETEPATGRRSGEPHGWPAGARGRHAHLGVAVLVVTYRRSWRLPPVAREPTPSRHTRQDGQRQGQGKLRFVRSSGSTADRRRARRAGRSPATCSGAFRLRRQPERDRADHDLRSSATSRHEPAGRLSSPTNPNPSFSGTLTITGGSGRYSHASG